MQLMNQLHRTICVCMCVHVCVAEYTSACRINYRCTHASSIHKHRQYSLCLYRFSYAAKLTVQLCKFRDRRFPIRQLYVDIHLSLQVRSVMYSLYTLLFRNGKVCIIFSPQCIVVTLVSTTPSQNLHYTCMVHTGMDYTVDHAQFTIVIM